MKHHVFHISDSEDVKLTSARNKFEKLYQSSKSTLVVIYGSTIQRDWELHEVAEYFQNHWPKATVIAVETENQIINGKSYAHHIGISLSFYESVEIEAQYFNVENEVTAQESFEKWLTNQGELCKLVVIFSTPHLSLNFGFLRNLKKDHTTFPIIGGGVGSFFNEKEKNLYYDGKCEKVGLIAICFLGEDLEVYTNDYLGWKSFSQELTVTETENEWVKTIDGMRAFDIYQKYLGIDLDENLYKNTNSFPFLVEKAGSVIARVPVFVNEAGWLKFAPAIELGERFRIGFADPAMIVSAANEAQEEMANFLPEGIFIFSCVARRELLGESLDLENYPYQMIAPTSGIYSIGEYHATNGCVECMNATFTVMGLREGKKKQRPLMRYAIYKNHYRKKERYKQAVVKDPLAVSRLVQFIGVVTQELEIANKQLEESNQSLGKINRELERLSVTDKLTQVYNRMKLDELLNTFTKEGNLSVILMDIDHFKKINDQHGHLYGDEVLKKIAQISQAALREGQYVGRWGGEEFLFVLKDTLAEEAVNLARALCQQISSCIFENDIHQTCSFGVSAWQAGDTEDALLDRADRALYDAKRLGRNRVEVLIRA